MWPSSCSISSLSSSSSCSCWALWEREPRADLELQRALPAAATRPRRQNENPARVWHLKREVARAGSRESSGGLGERGLHQAKQPVCGKYSARDGRYAGLFAVRLRVCAPSRVLIKALIATCAEFLELPRRAYRDRARPPWQVR